MITVNGEQVDPALIDETFMRIKADAEARSELSCCERDDEFRSLAEDEVIEGVLLAQEAERRIPEPSKEDTREAFEKTLRQWRDHGASWDLLEDQREALRGEVVANLRMERFAESVWGGLPELTEDDLRAWHREHEAMFRIPARAKVLHLLRFPEDPEADYSLMLDLRSQLLEGADFNTLARAHTQKRDGGIDLGWITRDRTLNPFEVMLFSLREREISPVFFYEQALHLVLPEVVEPGQIVPFEDTAEKVRELALADQRRQALHDLAVELRKSAGLTRD